MNYSSYVRNVSMYIPPVGSAAERCGLRLGDILISINETLINDKSHNEIMELLKEVRML